MQWFLITRCEEGLLLKSIFCSDLVEWIETIRWLNSGGMPERFRSMRVGHKMSPAFIPDDRLVGQLDNGWRIDVGQYAFVKDYPHPFDVSTFVDVDWVVDKYTLDGVSFVLGFGEREIEMPEIRQIGLIRQLEEMYA